MHRRSNQSFLLRLLHAGWLLVLTPAEHQPSPNASFHFSAQLGGWQVEAVKDEIKLTWKASGVSWTSSLIGLTWTDRTTYEYNGCWKHDSKKHSKLFPVKSEAELTGGRLLADHQTVVLEGSLVSTVKRVFKRHKEVFSNWTISFKPEGHGALSFTVDVATEHQLNSTAGMSDHEELTGRRTVYRWSSAELSLNWKLLQGEQLLGAGEQYSKLNLRGESFYIWTAEQGIGRGREPITQSMDLVASPCAGDMFTTYSAVPALLSTRGYGIALDNMQLIKMDLGSSLLAAADASMTVISEDTVPKISGHIWAGTDVRSLLPGLTEITGRMQAPPAWTQEGLIVGDEGGHEVVEKHIDMLLEAKVPVSGVWIQDWSGKIVSNMGQFVWWNWALDESRYPKEWFRKMASKGIKVLTYINPFLTSANQTDGRQPQVFLEALRLGHLVKDSTGNPIIKKVSFADFKFGMIDVFSPAARKWWQNIIRCNVLMACEPGEDGKPLVHAWMHDYGEYFPLEGAASQGGPQGHGTDLHNQFPIYSTEVARAASADLPNVTFFTRSGGLRSPGTSKMFWLGDQLTTYDACDGLQSALIGTMSGGLSGWTVNHGDIGAFTMSDRLPWLPIDIHFKRDSELNVRWLELSVFMNAMYRSHPGLIPNISSQLWDPDVTVHTKRMTELFRDLSPYRDFLFSQAAQQGLPLVRHGILVEPRDRTWFQESKSYTSDHCKAGNEIGMSQFYFGDDVIVAPVLRQLVGEVYAYIPRGNWMNFWSRKTVRGPSYEKWPAPLGQPPFFFKMSGNWTNFFDDLSKHYSSVFIDQVETFV